MPFDTAILGSWIHSFLSIFILSFVLVKPNKLSDLALNSFIGSSFAHLTVNGIVSIYEKALIPISQGKITLIIPIIFGLLLFTTISKRYKYMSLWSIALMAGVGTGLAMRGIIETDIIKQLVSTILPVYGVSTSTMINNIFVIVGVLSVIAYFTFTGAVGGGTKLQPVRKIARYMIMIYLGTVFARYYMLHQLPIY